MPHEIWAAYSVRDHLEPAAFLADVVLYDRLVVPVPAEDEPGQWTQWEDNGWEPARQARLLHVLGDAVKPVPWNAARRMQWGAAYLADRAGAGGLLHRGMGYQLTAEQILDRKPAMAIGVAATTPYWSLAELMKDFGIERRDAGPLLPGSTISAVVGRELLLPKDDARDEFELLSEAVDATRTTDFRLARSSLHHRLADFCEGSQTDLESVEAAVVSMQREVDKMHRALQKRRVWTVAHRVFSFAEIVLGSALAGPLGGAAAAGKVGADIGVWTTSGRLASNMASAEDAPDLAMLIDVRHRLSQQADRPPRQPLH